jgi:VanZ family protein
MDIDNTKHLYFKAQAIVLTLLILFLSLMPSNQAPQVKIKHLDKVIHFIMYFVLAVSYYVALKDIKSALTLTFVLAFFLGFLTEILQYTCTNTRSFDIFDIFANTFGSFFAILFIKNYLYPRKQIF